MLGTKIYGIIAGVLATAAMTSAGLTEVAKDQAQEFQNEYDNSYAIVQEYLPEAKNSFTNLKGSLNEAIVTVRDASGLDMSGFFDELIEVMQFGLDFSENGINAVDVNFAELFSK